MLKNLFSKAMLLTIVAGLWALTLAQISPPAVRAQDMASSPEISTGLGSSPVESALAPAVPSASELGETVSPLQREPVRWRISHAVKQESSLTFCGTAVIVRNLTSESVRTQVSWVSDLGTERRLQTSVIPGGRTLAFLNTGTSPGFADEVSCFPFCLGLSDNDEVFFSDFRGYAEVLAADPRVLVSAYQYCRDGLTNAASLVSATNIPAFPVGSTVSFFQTWAPVADESPLVTPPR